VYRTTPPATFTATFTATVRQYVESFCLLIGWYDHRSKYLTLSALLSWTALGVLYGMLYERWDVLYALRFAIATMSASGLPVPPCEEKAGYRGCQLGYWRAVFVGVYVLVGVPLFAFTLGQVRAVWWGGGGCWIQKPEVLGKFGLNSLAFRWL
jgi:hypothetical protein